MDLKRPYRWEERRILIKDHIWYVPVYQELDDPFTFPGWGSFFTYERPICIEYCSGNGNWIIEKAKQNPEKNWVAIEMQFSRVSKIWARLKNQQLSNLYIICGEASMVTENYIPSQSIAEIFVNFPDPWPKTRHAKHRLVQPGFIDQIARILQPESAVTLVTDDADYSSWSLSHFHKSSEFISFYPSPYYIHDYPDYGTSYFDALWRGKGKKIHYHKFIRR